MNYVNHIRELKKKRPNAIAFKALLDIVEQMAGDLTAARAEISKLKHKGDEA